MSRKKVIGILSGGISAERYLSLRSGDNIAEALKNETSMELYKIDWATEKTWILSTIDGEILLEVSSLQKILDHIQFDCIFNAFNGAQEIDGRITAVLDLSGVPYVGNSFFTCVIGINKIISKMFCREHGLPVVREHVIFSRKEDVPDSVLDAFGFPCIVKPANSGSSCGIHLIRSRKELIRRLRESSESLFPYLLEPFIVGREYCTTVIGPLSEENKLLSPPTMEVVYTGEFFDEDCKKAGTYRVVDAKLPEDLEMYMVEMAQRFHRIIGASVLSRTDFIVDTANKCWILEINTHPGLGSCSIVPAQLARMGVSFKDFILRMVEKQLTGRVIENMQAEKNMPVK